MQGSAWGFARGQNNRPGSRSAGLQGVCRVLVTDRFLRFSGSVQLCACGDVGIHHQQMQALAAVLLVDSGDEHPLGVDAHHAVLSHNIEWTGVPVFYCRLLSCVMNANDEI